MEIKYCAITCIKIGKVYIASTEIEKPFKAEVNMTAKTEETAIEKLKLFLKGEPYKHLI